MISSTGILSIDLTAIQFNWLYVFARLREGAQCAAVVKANAYGVGAVEVTKALYAVGCRYFYVVTLHEAVELRNALPNDVVLYVLGGVPNEMENIFVDFNLIPVLYSRLVVDKWVSYCAVRKQAFPCALKLNTGMTRLGLDVSELDQLLSAATDRCYLNPILVMSHLACADESVHPQNNEQLECFNSVITHIKSHYPQIKTSLANSSGAFLGNAYHFDMVRIGAALYGINPCADLPNPLKSAINLKLPVLQIRITKRSEFVGYGAMESVPPGARLAVVAGGYADGIHRSLGSSPRGQIDGFEVKAVGRVSMDSCVFDITPITGEPSYIEVINDELSLDYLMRVNKALGYEVLTSLGHRYKRHYFFTEVKNE